MSAAICNEIECMSCLLNQRGGVGVCGWDERINAAHLSVFCTCGHRSSLPWLRMLSARSLFSRARDCTIFMLYTLTDIYVERVTAHRIERYDHSCFHNLRPNSKTKLKCKNIWEQGGPLVFRGPYAACIFCVWEDRLCIHLTGVAYQDAD